LAQDGGGWSASRSDDFNSREKLLPIRWAKWALDPGWTGLC